MLKARWWTPALLIAAGAESLFAALLMIAPVTALSHCPYFSGARTLGSHGAVAVRELGALQLGMVSADVLVWCSAPSSAAAWTFAVRYLALKGAFVAVVWSLRIADWLGVSSESPAYTPFGYLGESSGLLVLSILCVAPWLREPEVLRRHRE